MSSKTRHKSCVACIQTKRKCDRSWPRCQRCVARGSGCQYIGRHCPRPPHMTDIDAGDSPRVTEPPNEHTSSGWQLQTYPADLAPLLAISQEGATFEFPNHPFSLGTMYSDGPLNFNNICNNANEGEYNSSEPDIQNHDTPHSKLKARVEYVAKRLASTPQTFAEQGQTMFIHRIQFQHTGRPALRDAMSACALYCMKNEANQTLVLRDLEHRSRQLIASTDVLTASKAELLAALQALLLYQIIRLFDGDIRLRSQAEADECVALFWASQLRAHMGSEARAMLPSISPAESSVALMQSAPDWQIWLVDESIRRTVIATYMLRGVYSFLKFGYDTTPDLRVFFTAQAALWGAQSELGWNRAREERHQLQVLVTDWEETMLKARPLDLEELSVLIMVMLWGASASRRWLGRDLAIKYSLELE